MAGRRVGVLDGDTVIDITAPRAGAGSVLDLLIAGRTAAAGSSGWRGS